MSDQDPALAQGCVSSQDGEGGLVDAAQFMAEVAAEAWGWLPLNDGAYLHVGADHGDADVVIQVVGALEPGLHGMHVLLLT